MNIILGMNITPPEIFKVLSSPIKYGVIEILGPDRRLSFKDIEDELKRLIRSEVYSSLLSNHLRTLKNGGYVDQDSRGLYYLTSKGLIAYNLINSVKQNIVSKTNKRIINEELYSEDAKKKIDSLYTKLSLPGSYRHRRRILSKIISFLAQYEEDIIPESKVLLDVIYHLEKEDALSPITYTVSIEDGDRNTDNIYLRDRTLVRYTYNFVVKNSLLGLFSENSVYMKLHPSGILTLNLVDPPKHRLWDIVRKNRLYWELNLTYNESLPTYLADIIPLLDSQLKTTVSINIENNDKSVEDFLKKLSLTRMPLKNTLIVIKYRKTLLKNKNLLKVVNKLINKGYPILFSKSCVHPTISHIPVDAESTSIVIASVTTVLPSIFLSSKPVNPNEKISYTIRDLNNAIVSKKIRKIQHTLNSLEIKKTAMYIHYAFVGLEAALIAINPPYRDLIKDKSSITYSSKILLSKAEKIVKNVPSPPNNAGINTLTTFYSPLYPFHKAVSNYTVEGSRLHLHINAYSAASYNTALGIEAFLRKNSLTHKLPTGIPPYIVEVKIGSRASVFLLEKAIKFMEDNQARLYSFSLFPIYRCMSCDYTSPLLRSICPVCFSNSISNLFRPTLKYLSLKSPEADEFMLEEYVSRPFLTKSL